MTVGSDHHGDLDALRTKSGDAPSPFSFDQGSALQAEAKFGEELDGGIDVFHHDSDVVHTTDCHAVALASNGPALSCRPPVSVPGNDRRPRASLPESPTEPRPRPVSCGALLGGSVRDSEEEGETQANGEGTPKAREPGPTGRPRLHQGSRALEPDDRR